MSVVVRNEDDLAGIGPVAFLGSVNGLRAGRPLPLILEDPDSNAATPYRVLAAKIALSNGKQPLRSLLVLDAHGGRSSARLAASLAGALAEGGARVALIDTDEGGEIAALFGLYREKKGDDKNRLVQKARPLRVGRVSLDRFRFRRPGLTIIRPRTRVEPLELEWAGELLERVLTEADLVVVAAPPVDRSPNALVWSRLADATVLVVERDHTKREEIPAAVDSLRIAGGNVIGTVLCRDRLF